MERGGRVPFIDGDSDGKRSSEANYVFSWFDAMATSTEKQVCLIKPPDRDEGEAQRIGQKLNKLVNQRILEELRRKGGAKEIGRLTPTTNSMSAILTKGKASGVVPDSTMFAKWRSPDTSRSSQPLMTSLGKRAAVDVEAETTPAEEGSPSRVMRASRNQPAAEADSSSEEEGGDGGSPQKPIGIGLDEDSD
tara:strand:+ start:111 stop:686 length:576 start_codon:yes stop_codon:yes gene_type:complete